MELFQHLQKLEAAGDPIKVGMVGCGQMGSGMVHAAHNIAGLEIKAIADIDVSRPLAVMQELGIPKSDYAVTNAAGAAEDALRQGKYVITEDAMLLTGLEGVEAVTEVTGSTEIGAKVAWNCILNQKHIVMLNVETDVTVGVLLNRMARKTGCVYTVAMGDEPGVCRTLYNFARNIGFEVVCLGKGKNNPIDRDATPDSCRADAEAKGMNPKMLTAFRDGTKTMVELAAMSNSTGLVPDVPGCHGPKVDVPDLAKVLVPKEAGGILSQRGRVDFSTGKVAPGVFAIVTSSDAHTRADMKFLSMGEGPYYTLYRPYHLCNLETPISIAEAVIYEETTMVANTLVSEVVSIAKRDLKTGEIVQGIGSADIFSTIYTCEEAEAVEAVPMGLVPGAKVIRDIHKGSLLTTHNIAPDTSRLVYHLRQMQDAMLAPES
jgi:predicted homoserine dehydrogenase-like protein